MIRQLCAAAPEHCRAVIKAGGMGAIPKAIENHGGQQGCVRRRVSCIGDSHSRDAGIAFSPFVS